MNQRNISYRYAGYFFIFIFIFEKEITDIYEYYLSLHKD